MKKYFREKYVNISLEKKIKKIDTLQEETLLTIHMKELFIIAEVIIAILLIISILLQSKNVGMGSMGGEDDSQNFSTKRGAEKVLEISSIVLATLFGIVALIYPFFL